MAGIGSQFIDLIDVEKSRNPDGSMADVIEMLVELNPMLKDAYAVKCNNGTKHRTTIRTGLPTVGWGSLYKGITQSKSTKAQVEDVTGFVEGLSTVDKRLLDLSGTPGAVRLSEAKSFMEAMEQEVQEKLIYGNSDANPDQILGLAPRFSDPTAPNGKQIINGGGAGADNTSIWFVTWGDMQTHLIYPDGSGISSGITREDKGEQRVLDENNDPYFAMEETFTHHVGLTVRDWRYVVRIANIDASEVAAGNVDLYALMRQAYYQHFGRRTMKGKTCIYMNTDMLEALDALATNAGANDNFVRLGRKEVQGEEVQTYRGMTIRETDALMNTEELVTFA
jgi:hypothetical protein